MPDLGRAALVTSLLLLVYALVAGSFAAWRGRRRLAESAQNALIGSFGATAVAAAVLLSALARHDFSFRYVAQHTSRELPLGYTLKAFWGGQGGSLRRWTLAAWAFLGVGQLLGAHWAYVEIGWGGYYAWDPVENAALMPWLAATAFLHSVMIQEKRGMLKVWNVLLVVLAFCLSLFGT